MTDGCCHQNSRTNSVPEAPQKQRAGVPRIQATSTSNPSRAPEERRKSQWNHETASICCNQISYILCQSMRRSMLQTKVKETASDGHNWTPLESLSPTDSDMWESNLLLPNCCNPLVQKDDMYRGWCQKSPSSLFFCDFFHPASLAKSSLVTSVRTPQQ